MLANNPLPATNHPAPANPAASSMPPKKKKGGLNWRIIAGILVLLVLMVGGGAAFMLQQQQQDIRQQASGTEPGGGGGCLPTQRSVAAPNTCGGTAIAGCTNDCSCGYTGGSCANKATGNPCWSDGQCQSGQCSGSPNNPGTCQAGVGSGACPSGFQPTRPTCGNLQYIVTSGSCFKCQEAATINVGQTCTAQKCICSGGDKGGQVISNGQSCTKECWHVASPAGLTLCVPSSNAVSDCRNVGSGYFNQQSICEDSITGTNTQRCWKVGSNFDCNETGNPSTSCDNTFGLYTTQSECRNAASRCYDSSNNCFAKYFSRSSQTCQQRGSTLFSTTTACLADSTGTGGTGGTDDTCQEQLGAGYNSQKLACESNPNNVFLDSLCACRTKCNANSADQCIREGIRCVKDTDRLVAKYYEGADSTCTGQSDGGGDGTGDGTGDGGGAAGQYMCSNSDKQGVPVKKWLKFTCDNGCYKTTEGGVTAWRCYDNRVESTTGPLTLDGACGQVDQLSGDSDATYCGLEEYTCGEPRCQTGGTPPPGSIPSPSPSPSPVVGPQCLSISISNTSPKVGESVTFTCGQVSGVSNYQFRVVTPNGDFTYLQATGRTSAPYAVPTTGRFAAQCRVCTDAYNRSDFSSADSTCQPWENVDLGGGGGTTPPGPIDEAGVNPKGSVNATCDNIVGWACDGDDYTQALKVQLYDNTPNARGTLIGEVTANRTREQAVADICGGNAAHGYQIAVPDSMKDGSTHNIYAIALNLAGGSDVQLSGSPKALDTSACTGASFTRDTK